MICDTDDLIEGVSFPTDSPVKLLVLDGAAAVAIKRRKQRGDGGRGRLEAELGERATQLLLTNLCRWPAWGVS